jgi:hypothetical protein
MASFCTLKPSSAATALAGLAALGENCCCLKAAGWRGHHPVTIENLAIMEASPASGQPAQRRDSQRVFLQCAGIHQLMAWRRVMAFSCVSQRYAVAGMA